MLRVNFPVVCRYTLDCTSAPDCCPSRSCCEQAKLKCLDATERFLVFVDGFLTGCSTSLCGPLVLRLRSRTVLLGFTRGKGLQLATSGLVRSLVLVSERNFSVLRWCVLPLLLSLVMKFRWARVLSFEGQLAMQGYIHNQVLVLEWSVEIVQDFWAIEGVFAKDKVWLEGLASGRRVEDLLVKLVPNNLLEVILGTLPVLYSTLTPVDCFFASIAGLAGLAAACVEFSFRPFMIKDNFALEAWIHRLHLE